MLVNFTVTTQRKMCPLVHKGNVQFHQVKDIKFFLLHLNKRLTWQEQPLFYRSCMFLDCTQIRNVYALELILAITQF
jgi:hypothetical protein